MTNSSPKSWTCTGHPGKTHDEIENWGDTCSFPGCQMVCGQDGQPTLPKSSGSSKSPVIPVLVVGLFHSKSKSCKLK